MRLDLDERLRNEKPLIDDEGKTLNFLLTEQEKN